MEHTMVDYKALQQAEKTAKYENILKVWGFCGEVR